MTSWHAVTSRIRSPRHRSEIKGLGLPRFAPLAPTIVQARKQVLKVVGNCSDGRPHRPVGTRAEGSVSCWSTLLAWSAGLHGKRPSNEVAHASRRHNETHPTQPPSRLRHSTHRWNTVHELAKWSGHRCTSPFASPEVMVGRANVGEASDSRGVCGKGMLQHVVQRVFSL